MLIDMHVHSRRSNDSNLSVGQAVKKARCSGIHAICLTEHESFTSASEIHDLAIRLNYPIIGGAEISTATGHFLVYDTPNNFDLILNRSHVLEQIRKLESQISQLPTMTRKQVYSLLTRPAIPRINDLIDQVHAAGGIIFWAHPMDDFSELRKIFNQFIEEQKTLQIDLFIRWLSDSTNFKWLWSALNNVDGFEVYNGSHNEVGLFNYLTGQLAELLNKPGIAGSDSHSISQMGYVATSFDIEAERGMNIRIKDLLQISKPKVVFTKPIDKGGFINGIKSRLLRTR